jgi:hypothetical protein
MPDGAQPKGFALAAREAGWLQLEAFERRVDGEDGVVSRGG